MAFSSNILTASASISTSMLKLNPYSNTSRFALIPFSARTFRATTATAAARKPKDEDDSDKPVFSRTKAKLNLMIVGMCNGPWQVKEDDELMYAKCDLPGVNKAGMKLTVVGSKVLVKGEEEERDLTFYKGNEKARKYEGSIEFMAAGDLKMDQMEAVIKNGRLLIVVPKIKSEEKEGSTVCC